MASQLFSPIVLRGLTLPNRVVVSPMCQYAAENGSANDWHLLQLGQFSFGGSGALVMTEATAVVPEGRISPMDLTLCSDENEAALKRVIDFCKQFGPAKHGIQLGHAGRKASTNPPPYGGKPLKATEGAWQTVAPSPLPFGEGWHTPRALSVAEIADVREAFVAAVIRADRIGYDVVELQVCHGYLLHEFLSPLSNQRDDSYGGCLDNRMRLTLEVFAAMREAWPPHKPMGVRISATDWIEGGWDVGQSVELGGRLKTLGCDFIDVSSGALDPRQKIPIGPAYQAPLAEAVRRGAGIPTMAVGLITRAREAEAIIVEGRADFISMGRGAMWDPRWAWHAAEELGAEAPYAAKSMPCHPSSRPWIFPERRRN